jgi:hypothetical protein
MERGLRKMLLNRQKLSRFSARIIAPMNEDCRYCEFSKLAPVKVFLVFTFGSDL